jgi:hypothetical protein
MNQPALIKDKEEFVKTAIGFFQTLFGKKPSTTHGDIEIRTFPKAGFAEQHFCGKTQEAAFLAYKLCNSGIDTYFGVNPRVGNQGKKQNIHYLVTFHAEIDYGTDGHNKASRHGSYKEALKAIQDFELPPTLVNHSGGGFHCYWVLNEPVKVEDMGIKTLESINKAICQKLGGDNGTHNLDRVLRVPGTFNFKLKDNPREVTAVITDGPKYDYQQFIPFIKEEKTLAKETRIESTLTTPAPEMEFENLSDVSSLPVPNHIKNLILHGKDKNYSSRSEADQAVITSLISRGITPIDIKEIFLTYPIGEKYREHLAPDKYLDHCIESAKKLTNLTDKGKRLSNPSCGGLRRSHKLCAYGGMIPPNRSLKKEESF